MLGDEGRTLFYDMMFNRAPVHFYAFDILWLDGEDLRGRPLMERKPILQEVVSAGPDGFCTSITVRSRASSYSR